MDKRQLMERIRKRFTHEQLDLAANFYRLCMTEKRRHPSVKLVRELAGTEPQGEKELLDYCGCPNVDLVDWGHDESYESVSNRANQEGGFVITGRLPGDARLANFVFIWSKEEFPEERFLRLLVLFMHEMGHVDDIEKAKFLCPGGAIDLVSAEEYANRYALRRMMHDKLIFPVAALLESIIKQSTRKDDDNVYHVAADRIVKSGEYRQYRQFVGDLIDEESIRLQS